MSSVSDHDVKVL